MPASTTRPRSASSAARPCSSAGSSPGSTTRHLAPATMTVVFSMYMSLVATSTPGTSSRRRLLWLGMNTTLYDRVMSSQTRAERYAEAYLAAHKDFVKLIGSLSDQQWRLV